MFVLWRDRPFFGEEDLFDGGGGEGGDFPVVRLLEGKVFGGKGDGYIV
jgi:hypothetical protein